MNEEIDEYDIYHQDFTTVTEWEVFIARIEEVINEWRLCKSKLLKSYLEYTKKWICKSEDVKFNGVTFTFSYHKLEPREESESQEESDSKAIFEEYKKNVWVASKHFMDKADGSPFPVSTWYGLKRYLMVCPSSPLVDPSFIKLVMSSVNIAFANSDCGVPLFVKIREHWQHCYLGFYEDNDHKTSFDTIHLKRKANQYTNLNDLVGFFKTKIGSPIALDAVVISAKISYEMKDLECFAWKKATNTNEFLSIDGFDVKKLTELPFGCEESPLQSAMFNIIRPQFYESMIDESIDYMQWKDVETTITLKMRDDLICQLSETVANMMDLLDNTGFLMDILGLTKSLGLLNPLHKITEAPITISKLVKAAIGQSTNVSEFKGPITDDLLMPLLYYIFPDAVEDGVYHYPQNLEVEAKPSEPKLCGYIKTSPEGGLVWRLSVTAARLLDAGGLPYLAHLWYEFTQELQYRWEHKILLPGVAEGVPNARTCLLHQKLQLLNCCITRASEGASGAGAVGGNSDEDEFFDCEEEAGAGAEDAPLWDRPVGRLSRLADASLKNGAPLYIPKTQDPAPKTEDQLEEDAELMVRLGDDARASELRARMMSASLLSDMEAFKAANPGAELCDFVQWYSPRDWLPADGGALGERMLLPGNPWVEAWTVARPVPAARQRRLFDETREAEQVLHFLRSRSVAAVAELLLPAVLRAGAARATAEGARVIASCSGGLDKRRIYEIAARDLYEAEKDVCRTLSARMILGDGAEEGAPLSPTARARVVRAAAGGAGVAGGAAAGTLGPPARREYSLRVRTGAGPQLLRAVFAADMTIVGAFSEPTVCL